MSIWAVLKNIGSIIAFFRTFSSLIRSVAKKKSVPDCNESYLLLEQTRILLEKGVIDIPGVDEAAIGEAIRQIQEQLTCQISKPLN